MTNEELRAAVNEWWFPEKVDSQLANRLRNNYPEHAGKTDDELFSHFDYMGKYADTWDNLGDARDSWERLADAYLMLREHYLSTVQDDDGQECFAWQELSGAIDLDSIAETQDGVRFKILEGSMGWRFEHPERYRQDEEWQRLQAYGSVVPIVVRKLVEALGGP